MNDVIDRLSADHERIERFLGALERLAFAVERGAVESDRVAVAVDFIDRFVERFHHVREEHVLFQRLLERGRTSESLGDYLVHCHDECRDQLEGMRLNAAVDSADTRTGWSWNARAYAQLTREHLRMEDSSLFPAVRGGLDAEDHGWLDGRMRAMFPDEDATNAWADEAIGRIDPMPHARESERAAP